MGVCVRLLRHTCAVFVQYDDDMLGTLVLMFLWNLQLLVFEKHVDMFQLVMHLKNIKFVISRGRRFAMLNNSMMSFASRSTTCPMCLRFK